VEVEVQVIVEEEVVVVVSKKEGGVHQNLDKGNEDEVEVSK